MVGFKGFYKPTTVANGSDLILNLPDDEYIYFTGGKYAARRASGRSASLRTITEVGKPIPIRTYAKRALKAGEGGKGYPTSISVGGLDLHAGAKPAVYFRLVKDAKGAFRAKKAIPTPDPERFPEAYKRGGFKAGDIVIPAPTAKAVAIK